MNDLEPAIRKLATEDLAARSCHELAVDRFDLETASGLLEPKRSRRLIFSTSGGVMSRVTTPRLLAANHVLGLGQRCGLT